MRLSGRTESPISNHGSFGKGYCKSLQRSKIARGLACGRTKTTAIVTNVLGQHSFDSLCGHLRGNKFSLIVDESTDRNTTKHLCLVVRSVNNDIVKDDFFGLIQTSSADSASLCNKIVTFFQTYNIPYKNNLIGFAAEGANVMLGQHHSVAS
jgi:hypothetical protein